jgi:glutamate racemase
MEVAAQPIGVFDSGLGGLTVARALFDLLPDEPVVYFGDTGRFPYGPKPREDVMKYAIEIAELLLDRGAKMLVVACNTATSVALDELRARYDVPVVGVNDPALRAAARVTNTGRIGVIGTVGTIASGAYQRAVELIDPNIELVCQACPGFVEFVESGDVDSDQVYVLVERLLAPLCAAEVDTLVLGCTHYPLLARTISTVMGRDVTLVSSADETAFEVRTILEQTAPARRPKRDPGRHVFITSGDPDTFRRLGARFLGPEVVKVEAWQWN